MNEMTDQEFDQLITRAMDELPQSYIENLENVAIIMSDEPTPEQIEMMKIDHNHLLLGLFEGVPKTLQGSGWSGMLPSKITLFKHPLMMMARGDQAQLFAQIKQTLWHEMAHYYGLTHADMDARQST